MTDYHKEYTSTVHNTSGHNNISSDAEAVGLCNCAMIGRGVLVKPWLPLEIKEKVLADISATERLDILKNFW
ncbi:hypothetical protein EON63_00765 [archaeon]|nr:MAG: hypothetical protein EON63_00765 [archaeon]